MKDLEVETKRGTILEGVLFCQTKNPDTILILITGIHGNLFTNKFNYNFGQILNKGNIDFIFAQTCDTFEKTKRTNIKTRKEEFVGSFNEDFKNIEEDIEAFIIYAEKNKYKNIYLAGHSLGANKIVYYLSRNHDKRIKKYIILSPTNITYLLNGVTEEEKNIIREYKKTGKDDELIPFELFGWLQCITRTAYDWVFNNILNNVHIEINADFSQINNIEQSGAMLIGTYDRFSFGDPSGFLENINNHTKHPENNKLIFVPQTGQTYQGKQQEVAEILLNLINNWKNEPNKL